MKTVVGALAAGLVACSAAQARAVGFEMVSAPDPGDAPLTVGVWYPSDAPESPQALGLVSQTVAPGAPPIGSARGLIVMSHGTGGWLGDHYDTAKALAQAGFVVAAVSHTGDTFADPRRALRVDLRAPQVSRVIDYMTGSWPGRAVLDPQKIGVFGFSSGGFTALVAVGGVADLSLIGPHCAAHPDYYDCKLGGPGTERPPRPKVSARDPRIRAAVVAAPALGFTFEPAGLAGVAAPIQLWRAGDDRVLPHPLYAETVRRLLPQPPDYRVVEGADHFDFLPPCTPALAQAAPQICSGTFDRAGFHERFNAEVAAFFEKTLR